MPFPSLASPVSNLLASTLLAMAVAGTSHAQVVISDSPQIGSANPVSAEPLPSRPATTPCKVQLFNNAKFADFNGYSFKYVPPAECKGPWAKVIFSADITVTAGRQYDHSAAFFLGNAAIFRGTTPEPRAAFSPSWHVENDVTDLSALFNSPQTGIAHIDGVVDTTYTGVAYANAELDFYPASASEPAAAAPDVVLPVPNSSYTFYSNSSPLVQTVTLPTNVERAYLDVMMQTDEFWYTCVPNDVSATLQTCGGTGFREAEISIDGGPAGVAPLYPYIYTGGIDPYLWAPITGVHTLNFKPYRVDLTPFAGLLSNGSPHTIGVNVVNTQGTYFATGNLLLYTDHGKDVVTGGVLSNTLAAQPTPVITEHLAGLSAKGYGTADVSIDSKHKFSITGEVNTSHGKVTTTVDQHIDFFNNQQFTINAETYLQQINQTTTVHSKVTAKTAAGSSVVEQNFSYPLKLTVDVAYNKDGSGVQTTTTDQRDIFAYAGPANFQSVGQEEVKSTDTLSFSPSFSITGHSGAHSTALDYEFNSNGWKYDRSLTSDKGKLTAVCEKLPCR